MVVIYFKLTEHLYLYGSISDEGHNDGDEEILHKRLSVIDRTDFPMSDLAQLQKSRKMSLNQDPGSSIEKRSKYRRALDRLKSKNQALRLALLQTKADLVEERQKRSTMDQIYLSIRKDLNQRLEAEEVKVLNLEADLERFQAENTVLKDTIRIRATSSSSLSQQQSKGSTTTSMSSSSYRIGYDSSAFSLSGDSFHSFGGGSILYSSSNQDLEVGHQGDSEMLLHCHSYPSSTPGFLSSTALSTRTGMVTSEDKFISTDPASTFQSRLSRRPSLSSNPHLPTLQEEDDGQTMDGSSDIDQESFSETEGEDEICDVDDSEEEDDEEAPCTMMEMIVERHRLSSYEDEMTEDFSADAEETFESMAGQVLVLATRSKVTVAQTHLQLEDLSLKFDAQEPQDAIRVIAKELSRWWELYRVVTGGPSTGGWAAVALTSVGANATKNPKAEAERKVGTFFGPLLHHYVNSMAEQLLLLESLAGYASEDTQWFRNHNAILVALYKHDVLEADAVLEWWQGLTPSESVFGQDENSLRSQVWIYGYLFFYLSTILFYDSDVLTIFSTVHFTPL